MNFNGSTKNKEIPKREKNTLTIHDFSKRLNRAHFSKTSGLKTLFFFEN